MGSLIIIISKPFIKIRLQCVEIAIQLFTERDLIKLIQYRFMEPLADAIGLGRHRFGFRMVNVIYRQIKLVIMLFHFATELRPSISQYSQHWQALRLIERQDSIIQQVSRSNRRFGDIQLTVSNLRVGINEQ